MDWSLYDKGLRHEGAKEEDNNLTEDHKFSSILF